MKISGLFPTLKLALGAAIESIYFGLSFVTRLLAFLPCLTPRICQGDAADLHRMGDYDGGLAAETPCL